MNKWMQKFFMYLDRYHVKHHSLPNLKSAGLQAFKTLVFDKIKGDIVSAVLKQVNRERDGETGKQIRIYMYTYTYINMHTHACMHAHTFTH